MHLSLLSRFLLKEVQIPETNLVLRAPSRSDFSQWVKLREESSSFLCKWEPQWPDDDLTKIGFQRRLRSYNHQRQAGSGHVFFLFDSQNRQLMGGIGLTRVTLGTSRAATLGYWMGERFAGQGYMQKTVPALLDFAFSNLGLNRIEAACIPGNKRSIHLLSKCGFRKEGYAREYLEINGKQEDHILFAILKSEHRVQTAKSLF